MHRLTVPTSPDLLVTTVSGAFAVVGGFLLVVGAFLAWWTIDDFSAGRELSVDIRAASAVWLSPLLFVIAWMLLPPKPPAFFVAKCMVVGGTLTIPAFFIYSMWFHYWA